MDERFYAEVIRRRPEKARVLLDTSGAPLRAALDAGVFLVKPNLRELEQAQGRSLETDDEIETAARQLADGGHAEVALARGQPIEDAARFGVAAGAAAVMTPGSALCSRPDAERLYAQMTGRAVA